jgi:hypothetical protein
MNRNTQIANRKLALPTTIEKQLSGFKYSRLHQSSEGTENGVLVDNILKKNGSMFYCHLTRRPNRTKHAEEIMMF